MPEPEEGTMAEKTEHAKQAEHWLDTPRGAEAAERKEELQRAQVHASLAIAEQLERLNEKLDANGITEAIHAGINEIAYAATQAANRIGAS